MQVPLKKEHKKIPNRRGENLLRLLRYVLQVYDGIPRKMQVPPKKRIKKYPHMAKVGIRLNQPRDYIDLTYLGVKQKNAMNRHYFIRAE